MALLCGGFGADLCAGATLPLWLAPLVEAAAYEALRSAWISVCLPFARPCTWHTCSHNPHCRAQYEHQKAEPSNLNVPRGCIAHLNEDLVRFRGGMMCLPPPSCLLFSSFLLDEKLLPCISITESAGLWPLHGRLPGSRVVPDGANSPSSLASLLTIHVPAQRRAWHVRTYLLSPTGCAMKQTYQKRRKCFSPTHRLAHRVHSRHL